MKAKLFTHSDLDGVGCAIVMKSLFPEAEGHQIDVSYCEYGNVNEKISKFIEEQEKKEWIAYDYIFITDISVSEELAEKLEEINQGDIGPFVQLLDHHGTVEWLNKYDWARVAQYVQADPEHKSSGTSLIIEFFDGRPGFERKPSHGIRHFAETVRRYDTWEWFNIYKEDLPKDLDDIRVILGREKFVELMLSVIPTNAEGHEVYFDVKAQALLDQRKEDYRRYVEKKSEELKKFTWGDYTVGIVFAEEFISVLGNDLCRRNEDIDYVMMFIMGQGTISFRTIRDDINLGEIAKLYGGGGHPKAAGGKIQGTILEKFILSHLKD